MNRIFLASAISGLVLSSSLNAALTLVPGSPSTEFGKSIINVVVLNEETAPQTYHPSATLNAMAADGAVELSLVTIATDQVIQPGQFVRVKYVANRELPAHTALENLGTPVVATSEVKTATEVVTGEKTAPVTSEDESYFKKIDRYITEENRKPEFGLVETLGYRLKPHEPVYFLAGPNAFPTAKFQLSLKYHLLGEEPAGRKKSDDLFTPLTGLYLGYSQTSFWDLKGFSKPFYDNSYRPEIFYEFDHIQDNLRDWFGWNVSPNLQIGLQAGLKHESNGREDAHDATRDPDHQSASRSMNIVYLRPIFQYSFDDDYFITFAPSVHAYAFGQDDIRDFATGELKQLEHYRGFGDIKMVIGKHYGLQLAATGRIGSSWEKGSLQLDLSFPIHKLTNNKFDVYFHTQYFTGYGETLLDVDQEGSALRVGISLVR